MNLLREQYFPLTGKFHHRVRRWQRIPFTAAPECRIQTASPVSVVEYHLALPQKYTLAFVTDLHFHESIKCRKILRHLEEHLENCSPDYLLFGGDMCGDAADMAQLPEVLTSLSRRARKKCFAVDGNWEYGKDWLPEGFWQEFYARCNIEYLENRCVCDEIFAFMGSADVSSGKPFLPRTEPEHFNILLAHSPDTVIALNRGSAENFPRLILCGHTHGGQVNIPLLNRPLHLHSHYGTTFAHGVYRHRKRDAVMLVSAGLGELSFPLRFNCRRELLIIRTGETQP